MSRIIGRTLVVSATIACWLAIVVTSASATDAPPPPGVLILHSNQRPTPAQVVIEDTLREFVPKGFGSKVQIYSENLDNEWASLRKYGPSQAEFLRIKYGDRNIKVIATVSAPASRFAIEYHDRILPAVPVTLIAVPKSRIDPSSLPSYAVGVFEDLDPTPTLQLALRLHPDTRRLVIIRGAYEVDGSWDKLVREAQERLPPELEIEYLAGLSTADNQRRVAALSPDTVVYTNGYFVDGAGTVFSSTVESIRLVAQASAVPVYGAFDSQMGTGIVGGYMHRFEDEGKDAGAMIVKLLNGTAPPEVGWSVASRVPIVDWRQVRRWNIDEHTLPDDAVVMFREPTTWEKHRLEITVGLAVFLLQAGLIAALLLERRSRRRTATALWATQRQMNLAATAARISLWAWDTARDMLKTGVGRRGRTAWTQEHAVKFQDVVAQVHASDRHDLERAVSHAIATGQDLDTEYRIIAPDGSVRWVAVRGRIAEDNPQRLRGVALDVTERKAAEMRATEDRNALRHMTRVSLVGQLSAAIAHQLNQPLAAILGNAEVALKLLGREKIDLAELRAICGDIVSEDQRATDIIRRVSALYKRSDEKTEPIDLNELVRDTLELLRPELQTRHVAPATRFAVDLPRIEGGRVQLQQVVLNLALNAADAMRVVKPEKRELTLRTEALGGEVRLCVIDNGPGIDPGHLPTVFQPFWSTKENGMGMGLAICQTIVAAHGGRITASNNVSGGATFCVSLPAIAS